MWSLGCVAYALHTKGEGPLSGSGASRSVHAYKQALNTFSRSFDPSKVTDETLKHLINQLLTRNPQQRITAPAVQESAYFDNILVSTMRYLESLVEKPKGQRIQFMQGLTRILPQFPDRVLKRKILTGLLEELKDHTMIPVILPNVFFIAERMDTGSGEFARRILPALKPLFILKDAPQGTLALLERSEILLQMTSMDIFKADVMPLVITALESPAPMVQERALKVIPGISQALEYSTVKNTLFPKIAHLYGTTRVLSVRINTIICFHSLLKTLDKYTMADKLLPLLGESASREPALMVGHPWNSP